MNNVPIDNPFIEATIADIYCRHSHNYHRHNGALEALARLVSLESMVLEVGVGAGAFTEFLLSAGYDVRGLDRSEEMLRRASQQVRAQSKRCDLLEYDPPEKYGVVVSHSGGFTFKRGKFEAYYQEKEHLERAFQKVHGVLSDGGRFLVNRGEHENEINLGTGARLTIKQEEAGDYRMYTYIFQQRDEMISKIQRRLALTPEELQKASSPYFGWNFDNPLWIIGEKYDK